MHAAENPWRPGYEAISLLAWGVAFICLIFLYINSVRQQAAVLMAVLLAAIMALVALRSLVRHTRLRLPLYGARVRLVHPQALRRMTHSRVQRGQVWLGDGYEWQPWHTQSLYWLLTRQVGSLLPPRWVACLRNTMVSVTCTDSLRLNTRRQQKGAQWLHGLNRSSHRLYVPLQEFRGHTLLVATTRSIKTRYLLLLAAQAIHRQPREAVIVIDPKGDGEFRDLIKCEALAAGRGKDFVFFNPAFPDQSTGLDPVRNYNRPSEIASRIVELMNTDSADDPFKAFAWRVLDLITQALLRLGQRPSLVLLRRYIEEGTDDLLSQVLQQQFPNPLTGLGLHSLDDDSPSQDFAGTQRLPLKELRRLIKRYRSTTKIVSDHVIDGLIALHFHNREHAQKMLASLVPVLSRLTSGVMRALLSAPDEGGAHIRPSTDMGRIVRRRAIAYIGLDSLSDAVVGSAIGRILLSDLGAVAGQRYNQEQTGSRINLFIDEAHSVVNTSLISIANQGAGAGIDLYLATQTVSDFATALGSEDAAYKILGNLNNLVCGRVIDPKTQRFVCDKFGKTYIRMKTQSRNESSGSGLGVYDWSSGYSEKTSETEVDMVPASILGRMPDLEYFAMLASGKLVKGIIPVVTDKA